MMRSVRILAQGRVSVLRDEESVIPVRLRERDTEVSLIWDEALRASEGTLFNDSLFYFSRLERDTLATKVYVVLGEYRHLIAQRRGLDLGLTPIGVSGVCLTEFQGTHYVVLARRSSSVTQYPGAMEFVPSGGLHGESQAGSHEIDPLRVLLQEFEEEVGLNPADIVRMEPVGVIEDLNDNVIDICFMLHMELSPQKIRESMRCSGEYENTVIVPADTVVDLLVNDQGETVVPTSRVLAGMIGDFLHNISQK